MCGEELNKKENLNTWKYRNSNPNLTVHIENEHTKNTESNPFNKPKRDTMS